MPVYASYTSVYIRVWRREREREWTGKQGNGIVTNRIIINIGETSKQRDQCFSGIEVDKLITTNQYNGSREEWRSAGVGWVEVEKNVGRQAETGEREKCRAPRVYQRPAQ